MTSRWIILAQIIIIVVIFGFFSDIHASSCAIPTIPMEGVCPSFCDCNKTYPECQVPACKLNCMIQWYGICLLEWPDWL